MTPTSLINSVTSAHFEFFLQSSSKDQLQVIFLFAAIFSVPEGNENANEDDFK